MPTPWFQAINPLAIFVLAPLFAYLWIKLDKIGKQPSIPMKMFFGLGLMCVSVVVMVAAGSQGNKKSSVTLSADPPSGIVVHPDGVVGRMVKGEFVPFHAGLLKYNPTTKELEAWGVLPDTEADVIIGASAPEGFVKSLDELMKKSKDIGKEVNGKEVKSVEVELNPVPDGFDMSLSLVKPSVVKFDAKDKKLVAYQTLAEKEEKGLLVAAGNPDFRAAVHRAVHHLEPVPRQFVVAVLELHSGNARRTVPVAGGPVDGVEVGAGQVRHDDDGRVDADQRIRQLRRGGARRRLGHDAAGMVLHPPDAHHRRRHAFAAHPGPHRHQDDARREIRLHRFRRTEFIPFYEGAPTRYLFTMSGSTSIPKPARGGGTRRPLSRWSVCVNSGDQPRHVFHRRHVRQSARQMDADLRQQVRRQRPMSLLRHCCDLQPTGNAAHARHVRLPDGERAALLISAKLGRGRTAFRRPRCGISSFAAKRAWPSTSSQTIGSSNQSQPISSSKKWPIANAVP